MVLTFASCQRNHSRNSEEEVAIHYALDKIQINPSPNSSQVDSLAICFDPPLDTDGIKRLRQTFIAWGKVPAHSIKLEQIESMELADGLHTYLIFGLSRITESREFRYLIEVVDNGSKLNLKQFIMDDFTENVEPIKKVWIKRKPEGCVWMAKGSLGKGEYTGTRLIVSKK